MKFSLSNDDIDACGFFGCENITAWLPQRFLKSRRNEALEILKADDWREFKVGYHHSFHKISTDDYGVGMREGEEQTEFVKMDEPRQCSYSSKTWIGEVIETKIL